MKITSNIGEIRKLLFHKRLENKTIGFVPTMGALHKGHLSLIKQANRLCDYTVISIFVNPIQFGPNEDFEKYPRNLEKDGKLAEDAGADLIFTPETSHIIGEDLLTYVDIKKLSNNLCGAKRPGHFRGVCTIVTKFFNIINPDKAFFGKKDIQQLYILKKMTKDLNFDIDIIPCDIIREKDGLALSSRNIYLSKQEREDSLILSKSLKDAKKLIDEGEKSSKKIINNIKNMIGKISTAKIDYVKIVNEHMENTDNIKKKNIIALAVFIGKTRLIDNYIIGEELCF